MARLGLSSIGHGTSESNLVVPYSFMFISCFLSFRTCLGVHPSFLFFSHLDPQNDWVSTRCGRPHRGVSSIQGLLWIHSESETSAGCFRRFRHAVFMEFSFQESFRRWNGPHTNPCIEFLEAGEGVVRVERQRGRWLPISSNLISGVEFNSNPGDATV